MHTQWFIRKLKKTIIPRKKDILAILFFILIPLIFFVKLFYPEPSFFIVPEYGRSDILNFNLPLRFLLSNTLKDNQIPLWTKSIGTGFPIFAESQMGALYIVNLLLFKVFNFWLAFNLGYVSTFIIAGIGMYFFSKSIKISSTVSLLCGFLYSFSGFFIAHILHFNMIQAASLLPWIVWIGKDFFYKPKFLTFCVFALLVSQSIFVGHLQITFITLLTLFIFIIFDSFFHQDNYKYILKKIFFLILGVFVASLLSAIQILPSSELASLSIRAKGFSIKDVLMFSFPQYFFITFLKPFYFGSIANGTYPNPLNFDWNIFWENSGYIGILPILLAVISILGFRKQKKIILSKILMLLFAALLMMGKYSPLHFIYTFPPFSYFRAPVRFIIMFIFFAVILSGLGLENIIIYIKKRTKKGSLFLLIPYLIMILCIWDIYHTWFNYFPIYPVSKWMAKPEISKIISSQKDNGRVFTITEGLEWSDYYEHNGWKSTTPYVYFRNELASNQNILWDNFQTDSYVGVLWTRRMAIVRNILDPLKSKPLKENKLNQDQINMLNLTATHYLVSPYSISSENLELLQQITPPLNNLNHYYLYRNRTALPRARMVYNYIVSDVLNDTLNIINSKDFDPDEKVLLEKEIPIFSKTKVKNTKLQSNIEWIEDKDTEIKLIVNTTSSGLLVLADTYYPGWNAYVDNSLVDIYAANINQRVVYVPHGKHTVKFSYMPKSFNKGLAISLFSYITIISLIIITSLHKKNRES